MIEARLRAYIERQYPGYKIVKIEPLAPDTGATSGSTAKAAGYGKPVRLVLEGARESERLELVWRVASSNVFGHERRADRAAGTIQAFEDFLHVPAHVTAMDLGVLGVDGELTSIRDMAELFLVTTFAPGTMYIDDLRRIVTTKHATDQDLAQIDRLAGYLASLHVRLDDPIAYRRAIRDLVGSGEGIYGIVDGYPPAVPGVPEGRLREIEERCATWRWRLRGRGDRLTRTHGDFHPFNIVFGPAGELALLDASRGACGDPADDLAALAINFVFLAIDHRSSWRHGFGVLWRRWWQSYLAKRDDPEVLEVVPPFLAWRALVVANPAFYPQLSERGRHDLLGFAERVLEEDRLDPAAAEDLFPVSEPGVVVWFTGLPASGKSTLAEAVRGRLASTHSCVVLDSDEMREVLGFGGYDLADRDRFYAVLGRFAAMFARHGHIVLVAATAPRRAYRNSVREAVPHFIEVHVATPRAESEARDRKGLYAKARAGQAPTLPGVGVEYEPPDAPEVVAHGGLDAHAASAVERMVLLMQH